MILSPIQERIIEEAKSWVGTPWREGGSATKGITGGVDCSRFALMVYYNCGIAPLLDIKVVNPVYCQNRRNRSMILDWLDSYPDLCQPVPGGIKDARPCDLICSREGAIVHHIAILDGDGHHAYGAVARYGVMRYLLIGDDRQEKRVRAVYRVNAVC